MDNSQPPRRATLTRPVAKTPARTATNAARPAGRIKSTANSTGQNTLGNFSAPRREAVDKARGNVWRSDTPSGKPENKDQRTPNRTQSSTQRHNGPQPAPNMPLPSSRSDNYDSAHTSSGIRLNKRMADLGLCSRREADEWIANGWVIVNEQVAVTGQRVEEQDHIHIERSAYSQQEQQVTILLHKPVGYVSGQPEDGHPSAITLISNDSHWRGDRRLMRFLPRQTHGMAPAGRLDIDSTGLLVLTQDGRVARQLISQHGSTDKEYLVRVSYTAPDGSEIHHNVQAVFPPEQLALLRHGLSLDDQPLQPAQVDWQNPEQLRFVLTEGKKRQIRRMCEAVGLKVTALKRVRIGRVVLGDLPQGKWRYLHPDEQF